MSFPQVFRICIACVFCTSQMESLVSATPNLYQAEPESHSVGELGARVIATEGNLVIVTVGDRVVGCSVVGSRVVGVTVGGCEVGEAVRGGSVSNQI